MNKYDTLIFGLIIIGCIMLGISYSYQEKELGRRKIYPKESVLLDNKVVTVDSVIYTNKNDSIYFISSKTYHIDDFALINSIQK